METSVNKDKIGYVHQIRPYKGLFNIDLKELWYYRELVYFLIWRDIKVKYKQTALGALWALIIPFVQMLIFTIIFGKFGKMPTDGLNPQIFYYAGLLPWTYFATSVANASLSLVNQSRFIKKIYFPRLFVPTAPCLASFLDFFIAFILMIIMMFWYGVPVSETVLLLPFLMIVAFGSAAGASYFLSAINVKYRDITYAVPFIIQIWMYVSVIFPFSRIPAEYGAWKYLYGLNPMGGVIEGFRWSLLNKQMFNIEIINGVETKIPVGAPWELMLISTVIMVVIFLSGMLYFKRKEEFFDDLI